MPDNAGAAAHGWAAVCDHFGLHGLAFAAVGDREDLKIIAHGVNGLEEISRVPGDRTVAV